MTDLVTLASQLSNPTYTEPYGFSLSFQPIPGDVEVLKISIENREELPIYISIAEDELLCICYLFKTTEVKSSAIAEMNEFMLNMNIPMPLSSFAKLDDHYVIFGALSAKSNADDIIKEIFVLSDNVLEALEVLKDYLD